MKELSSMAGFHEKTSAKRKTIMSREFRQAVKARQDGNQGLHKPLTESRRQPCHPCPVVSRMVVFHDQETS